MTRDERIGRIVVGLFDDLYFLREVKTIPSVGPTKHSLKQTFAKAVTYHIAEVRAELDALSDEDFEHGFGALDHPLTEVTIAAIDKIQARISGLSKKIT